MRLLVRVGVLIVLACLVQTYEYISTEHPTVTYFNKKYIKFFNLTSQRHSRRDPLYYVGIHMDVLHQWGHNVTIHYYFYEWLTNQYKRGFVELHFVLCDLIQKDNFFGTSMRQGKLLGPCPFPPGIYHLANMTMSTKYFPKNFPFRKGRIMCNVTSADNKEAVGSGYIDMEIKTYTANRNKHKK